MSRPAAAILFTALVACVSLPAQAADLYQPPVIYEPPPPKVQVGGWYLRGYIGMTNQRVDKLDNVLFETTDDLIIHDKNFEAGVLAGGGVGYEFNDWLRVDATAEYRGETGFHGFDTFTDGFDEARFNKYTAKKSEWLILANAYADLGDWYGVTPYIGAGIGASRNSIHSFRDAGIDPWSSPTMAYADSNAEWDLAWALHAGVGFDVSERATVDLGYSYVHLGDGESGDIITYDGVNNIDNPMKFEDLTSHDFKLGLRYAFN